MANAGIKIFDSSRGFVASIEEYESCFFTRSWYQIGAFEIIINAYVTGAVEFVRGRFIQIGDDPYKIGRITGVSHPVDQSGKGSEMLSVTGYEAKGIFTQRVVRPLPGTAVYGIASTAEDVMKQLVYDQCGLGASTERRFANLIVEPNNNAGVDYALASVYKRVSDELEQISKSTDLGYFVYLSTFTFTIPIPFPGIFIAPCLRFDVSEGVDRTRSQSINGRAIFCTDYDTLKSAKVEDSENKYANYIIAGGQGEGITQIIEEGYTGGEPVSYDRIEMFEDAKELNDPNDLALRVQNKLVEFGETILIPEAQILTYSPLKYQTDYDLGDICTVSIGGVDQDLRLTEIKESFSHADYEIFATFGQPWANAANQTQAIIHHLGPAVDFGRYDMKYIEIDFSSALLPIKSTCYGCKAGADGIRLNLPRSSAALVGLELEFKKIDSTDSAVTLVPYGAETIDGYNYLLMIELWQTFRIINTSVGWKITKGVMIADTGWINHSDWSNSYLGTCTIDLEDVNGNFYPGEIIKESGSGITGIIARIMFSPKPGHEHPTPISYMVLFKMTGLGYLTLGNIITGQLSGATGTVSFDGDSSSKNQAAYLYHGFNAASHLLNVTIQSSTGAGESSAFQMGWEWTDGGTVSACVINGWDLDNLNIVTGAIYAPRVNNDGTDGQLSTEDQYYRIRATLAL